MKRLISVIGYIATLCVLPVLHAGTQPIFTIIPQSSPTISLPINGVATLDYTVTNQTTITRTLTMVPTQGITQVTTDAGTCAQPFTLGPNQSCTLRLSISGSQINDQTIGGPRICKTQADNLTADPFLCAQPSKTDILNISRALIERPELTVTPASILFNLPSQTKSFSVTNHSTTVTAVNIRGITTGTVLEGNITQDASDCTQVLPGGTCALSFTTAATEQVSLQQTFPIKGINTKITPATITIQLPQTAIIKVDPTEIILQATTGTPVTQSITVTNTTAGITATNISADITGALADAGVTQDASACATLAAGASCALVFTPGTTAVTTQTVVISGTNSSQVHANIGVNGAALAPLEITSGNNATLTADGVSTTTMTVQNNSTTETALNIAPNLSSSSLAGYLEVVENTCASVQKGATCSMTFESASTTTQVTGTFPIYGTNTTEVIGTLTVKPVPFIYVSDLDTNIITLCGVDSDGSLTNCGDSGVELLAGSTPEGVALNSTNTLAYYTDKLLDAIFKCNVTANTGKLFGCVNSGAISTALDANTQGLVFHPVLSNIVYVTEYPNTLSTCPLNADGTIGTCIDETPTYDASINVNNLLGLALNPTGNFAYLANAFSPTTVLVCGVNTSTGALTFPCANSTAPVTDYVAAVVITPDNQKAYLGGGNLITTCDVNASDGLLDNCVASATFTQIGRTVNLALNSTETKLYVTNDTNAVAICSVDSSTRLITDCISQVESSLWIRSSGLALLE
tara:strand:- start:289 stop:2541 length:2253 start_codon:yes stop_codon:yes gene_type:complete